MSSSKKIGGEYGDVRATIDGDKLNAYLVAHVPAVAAPVDIKQFKVGMSPTCLRFLPHTHAGISRSLGRCVVGSGLKDWRV